MADMSDTPAGMISRLDEAIARRGQTVTVTKRTGGIVTCKAHVRPVKVEELVGPVQQTWLKIILSPTGLSGILPLVKGDTITVDSKVRQVEFPKPIKSADTLVRFECMAAG